MKTLFLVIAMFLFFSCKTKSKEEQTNAHTDTAKSIAAFQQPQAPVNINDTLKIILETSSIPGDINTNIIKKLPEFLKALAALYAAIGGTMCSGNSCELTTALGLGKQGSDAHKALITKYFPNDSLAEIVVKQDCYLAPSGATFFSDFQYLNLINLGDTVKVDFNLMIYAQGKTSWRKGTDIYLFSDNKFTKLKRNI
ncbi:MAG TPA: hypothetical protein VGI61_09315 [Parafilimonas sp.]